MAGSHCKWKCCHSQIALKALCLVCCLVSNSEDESGGKILRRFNDAVIVWFERDFSFNLVS